MAKLLSGALIAYGPILPTAADTVDGSLFYKTDSLIGGTKGLYVYGFTADSNSVAFGQQVAQGWTKATADAVDADTLDGFDSTHFQVQDPSLDALAALSAASTGMYVITGSSTSAVRTLTPGSTKISISNGTGVTGNPTFDVVEANLTLSNMGGTLGVTHGGTGVTTVPTIGGVLYGLSSSTIGYTPVGTATSGSGTTQNWQVLTSTGAGAPAWLNATSLNVAHATAANTATSATSATTATTATNVAWTGVTGKPTTLAGYGITDDVPTTAYVDAADYLNFPPLAGTLKDNVVPVYGSFGFSLGVWNDTSFALVGNSGRQAVFYTTSTPIGDHRVYRMYRFSDNDSYVYDNTPTSAPFLLSTEKVNYIVNMGTFFAVLYITTVTFPETMTRVVIVKTDGFTDWHNWTFAYDVTSLWASKVNFGLVETPSGDRILRAVVSAAQDTVTLEVYDPSLVLLRSQLLYNRSTDVNFSDVTEIPATSMVAGTQYLISSVGSTNFLLYGAATNTYGTSFTATGPGTGTGTVSQRILQSGSGAFTLLNYSGKGTCYPFTWNPYLETFYVLFSSYYTYATPTDASTGFSWGLHVSWDVPKSWIESGVGTPVNKIPVKPSGYRYAAQPDATWNTDDGGMVSSWAYGQSNSSIITDEYSGDMYLTTKGSFVTSSIGTIRRLSYRTTAAPGMVAGTQYTISSVGTTNFTLYGASANTVGTSFTATGPGVGTGTADALVPFEYKTFGSNLTNKLEMTTTQSIPDGSPWSKTIDSYWGHVIGNNIQFHASSTRYGSVLVQALFSTTSFASVAQGQVNDTLELDSPSSLVNAQTTAPATIASNMYPGKFGSTVVAGVPTYYFIHPGALLYIITTSGAARSYTSTGLTVPAIPSTIGAETGLTDARVSAWDGNNSTPVYWAIATNTNGAHMLKCTGGVWAIVASNIHQTEINLGKANRSDAVNSIIFGSTAGNTLLTQNGRLLYHFAVNLTGGTAWYYGVFNTLTNASTTGSVNSFNAVSTGAGGYTAPNGAYPGSSWGYSSTLGYYRFQSTTFYDSAFFVSSRDIRTGATITEDQWFNGTAPRYQIYLTTESATGLVAYITPYPLFIGGYYCTTPTQSITLAPSAVNYVYATKHAGDRTTVDITSSTTLLPASFTRVLLAEITTDATNIVSQISYSIAQHDTVEELQDVSITTKLTDDVLSWNGSAWATKPSTSLITANTLALRDVNGDLSAQHFLQASANNENPTISQVIVTNGTDSVFRKASLASLGASISVANTTIADDTTTNATVYPTWVTGTTGGLPHKVSSSKLTFNPSSGVLSATRAVFTPNATGVNTGLNVVNGDITTYRSGGTTGVIYLANDSTKFLYFDGTNYNFGGTSSNGVVAAGDITAFSDARLKTDVVTIDHALDKVMALRGVDYTRIDGGTKSTGVIAQEVQEVLPRVVHETTDGTLAVSYGNMVGVLIEAIKEQQRQIDELRAELKSLKP